MNQIEKLIILWKNIDEKQTENTIKKLKKIEKKYNKKLKIVESQNIKTLIEMKYIDTQDGFLLPYLDAQNQIIEILWKLTPLLKKVKTIMKEKNEILSFNFLQYVMNILEEINVYNKFMFGVIYNQVILFLDLFYKKKPCELYERLYYSAYNDTTSIYNHKYKNITRITGVKHGYITLPEIRALMPLDCSREDKQSFINICCKKIGDYVLFHLSSSMNKKLNDEYLTNLEKLKYVLKKLKNNSITKMQNKMLKEVLDIIGEICSLIEVNAKYYVKNSI